jgi:hypothetical protein
MRLRKYEDLTSTGLSDERSFITWAHRDCRLQRLALEIVPLLGLS